MARGKYYKPAKPDAEPVETVDEADVDAVSPPVEEEAVPVTGMVLLKPHTHSGVLYEAGTPVSALNASARTLEKLKALGVI